MRMMFVLSLFGCNIGVEVEDTSIEEMESNTDSSSDDNEQSINETTFTITTNIVGDGVISPVVYQDVQQGETRQFTIMASEGYEIAVVTGTCGGTFENATYTTVPIVADCSVEVLFSESAAELVPYCENIPPELVNTVDCDPATHLDDWSVGAGFPMHGLVIRTDKILSIPFTSNAIDLTGTIRVKTNMSPLSNSGFYWHGWFSLVPGGEEVESCNSAGECGQCSTRSHSPNPYFFSWNQVDPVGNWCHLGRIERTMYLNMEIRCLEDVPSGCTLGDFYDVDYYLSVRNILD